jgi:hypothetical protein
MLTTRAQHGESRRAISEPVPGVVQGASKVVPAPARVMAGNILARSQWGIAKPHGWYEWEEDMLHRSTDSRQAPEQKQADSETLLYGPKGEALLVRRPRPVGFRMPK